MASEGNSALGAVAESDDGHLRTRIFISYSRKDHVFIVRLAAALDEQGYFADYDLGGDAERIDGGISATDMWWERLKTNIAAADVVIFAVSPDSVASKSCGDEIEEAQRLGKRLIPVLVNEVDFAGAPAQLRALNIAISFVARNESFEQSLDRLRNAVDTDILWLRDGRRLLEQATALGKGESVDASPDIRVRYPHGRGMDAAPPGKRTHAIPSHGCLHTGQS